MHFGKPSAIIICALLAGCTVAQPGSQAPQDQAATAAALARFDLGPAYIGGALPGGEQLIHPVPEAGSSRMKIDQEANARALALRGSPRWQLATRDADLSDGWYGRAFSCAAGVTISAESTPHIAKLLRRAAGDFGGSTGAVKVQFQRPRPFMVNGQPSCTPQDEPLLRGNGSYPSGHSAIGYGTAMVLANLFPDRAARLVARGRAFGNSRWVCNVHWHSDTEEARAFAAATFARLQANAEFRADLDLARGEAAMLEAIPESANCAAERGVLAGAQAESGE